MKIQWDVPPKFLDGFLKRWQEDHPPVKFLRRLDDRDHIARQSPKKGKVEHTPVDPET